MICLTLARCLRTCEDGEHDESVERGSRSSDSIYSND